MIDRYETRKKNQSASPGSKVPSASSPKNSEVNVSSYLMRVANDLTASKPKAHQQNPQYTSLPGWMQIDHSSPTANLTSRLRWVENAFREEEMNRMRQQTACNMMEAPEEPRKPAVDDLQVSLRLIALIRKRMDGMRAGIDELDAELRELESRLVSK